MRPVSYPQLSPSAEWKLITEAYYWDKVVEAYDRWLEAGAFGGAAGLDFFRIMEGEAQTRRVSEVSLVTPWLKLEALPGAPEELGPLLAEVCSEVAGRLGWNFQVQTLISFLTPEADVPWNGARFGYYMDKYPYDKICLPMGLALSWDRGPRAEGLTSEEQWLRRAVAHEYAHVITHNLTDGRTPHWVGEGISMLMESPVPSEIRAKFKSGHGLWQNPQSVETSFGLDRRNGENRERVRDAYDQAHMLVEYLHGLKKDSGLQRFLRAFADHSLWDELKLRLGTPPAEEALREVYGVGQAELFASVRP